MARMCFSLWNIARWKPNDLDLPFQFHKIKVKCYKVNWKAIYDLLYAYHTNFGHNDAPFMRHNLLKGLWPWFDF